MYSRNRWLIGSALFWAAVVAQAYPLGPASLILVALGTGIGWVFAVYLAIPSQYSAMVARRDGRRSGGYWNWKLTLALAFGMVALPALLRPLGPAGTSAFGTVLTAAGATMFAVGAFSRKLASVSQPNRPRTRHAPGNKKGRGERDGQDQR